MRWQTAQNSLPPFTFHFSLFHLSRASGATTMSWITPTADDIFTSLPEEERDLYATLGDGGSDVITEILTDTVAMVRGAVLANTLNVMDPDEATIPPECKRALLSIVRYELIGRLSAEEMDDNDPRTRLYNAAEKYLERKPRVSPGVVVPSNGVSLVSSRKRIAKRENLNGLL